jgi:hypothetical protein
MNTKTQLTIAAQALEESIGGQAACLRAVELTSEALRGSVPAWIATKDQMPPEGVRVFFMDTQYNRVGFDTYMGEGYTCTASHWMHIPALAAAPQPAQEDAE